MGPREQPGKMDSMQRTMLGALEHDQKKQQVNDAKLRAVAQRVEYDDFEKLVLGAHLKPVKPKSQQSADTSKPFDCFVLPKYEATTTPVVGPAIQPAAAAAAAVTPPPSAPKTSNEFLRAWRRQCKTAAEKLAYLRAIEPLELPTIFRTELDATVFDGIVEALREGVLAPALAAEAGVPGGEAEAVWVEQLLSHATRINRFELTLDFADKKTSATLDGLLSLLGRDAPAESTAGGRLDATGLAELRAKYKV